MTERAHAVTFDVEDWHALVRRRIAPRGSGSGASSAHVVRDTHRILDLLAEARVRATFFVVGSVAAAHPDLVREIGRRGHEIGSHSFEHTLISGMTAAQFRSDVGRSRGLLQDLSGQPVLGFRAPEFSVGHLDHWCFDVLRDEGFAYDSSVFPLPRARYGVPGAPPYPFLIRSAAKARAAGGRGALWEFPLATWTVGGARLPVAGGSYFRVLPVGILRRALARIAAEGSPAVLYFHPYEFHRGVLCVNDSTNIPRISWRALLTPASIRLHVLHNVATGAVARRLIDVLATFRFEPVGEILDREYAIAR